MCEWRLGGEYGFGWGCINYDHGKALIGDTGSGQTGFNVCIFQQASTIEALRWTGLIGVLGMK